MAFSLLLLVATSLSCVLGSYGQESYPGFNLGMFGVRGYYFTLGVLCVKNTEKIYLLQEMRIFS